MSEKKEDMSTDTSTSILADSTNTKNNETKLRVDPRRFVRENVLLFWPNVIGYFRIILAVISFYFMPFDPLSASVCYLLSIAMDVADGYAARYFNQSTKFGAILDQLTDRCSTLVLCTVLGTFYPQYALSFQLYSVLDISSHWLYLHSVLLQGRNSHKAVDLSTNCLLRLYYKRRSVLFTLCAANELFFASLYLLYFNEGPIVSNLNIGLFYLIAWVCAPLMAIKTVISFVHLITAAINVSLIDFEERSAAKNK